jgi:hypothetical protein
MRHQMCDCCTEKVKGNQHHLFIAEANSCLKYEYFVHTCLYGCFLWLNHVPVCLILCIYYRMGIIALPEKVVVVVDAVVNRR